MPNEFPHQTTDQSTADVPIDSPCPCGSSLKYENCCGPFLANNALAPTAETLMRSRYCAYATHNLDYVRKTWHPKTLPTDLRLVPGQVWIGLKIKRVALGQAADQTGIVEFVARYKRNGRAKRLHETSQFERLNGRWVYVSGDYPQDQQ
jgi:SEC-C motif domain protein